MSEQMEFYAMTVYVPARSAEALNEACEMALEATGADDEGQLVSLTLGALVEVGLEARGFLSFGDDDEEPADADEASG
jgi:hypothetical protein